jgi:hypothetical protein
MAALFINSLHSMKVAVASIRAIFSTESAPCPRTRTSIEDGATDDR